MVVPSCLRLNLLPTHDISKPVFSSINVEAETVTYKHNHNIGVAMDTAQVFINWLIG